MSKKNPVGEEKASPVWAERRLPPCGCGRPRRNASPHRAGDGDPVALLQVAEQHFRGLNAPHGGG